MHTFPIKLHIHSNQNVLLLWQMHLLLPVLSNVQGRLKNWEKAVHKPTQTFYLMHTSADLSTIRFREPSHTI